MRLNCNPAVAAHLHSNSQRAGVITEAWFAEAAYCLACESDSLLPTRKNTHARDFYCPKCGQPYELKGSSKPHGRTVLDGAYGTMMQRIRDREAPALMLLHYSGAWCVERLIAIHPVFLTSAVVDKRNALSMKAERRGHVMCNFRIDRIPQDGKIFLVENGKARAQSETRSLFEKSARFAEVPLSKRGWATLTLNVLRKIGKSEVRLEEIYAFEEEMHEAYPKNSHVRDKIRQQMQVLRDLGYVEFAGRGEYRILR